MTAVSVTTTTTVILAPNQAYSKVKLQNLGAAVAFIQFDGGSAVAANGYSLAVNGALDLEGPQCTVELTGSLLQEPRTSAFKLFNLMPISTTLRRLDGGIYINADGLRTDQHGIPINSSSITITTTGASPEGVTSGAAGTFVYDSVSQTLWVQPTSGGTTGWIQLI